MFRSSARLWKQRAAAVISGALLLGAGAGAMAEAVKPSTDGKPAVQKPAITMDIFLDRLMMAESGGRDDAKNARSTALGPYQFIVSTFLDVTQRHFPDEVENKSTAEILALRTNRSFARKAAAAYTKDNAAILAAAGQKPTFPNLRLAYLLGAGGAIKILSAPPNARLITLLGPDVIRANPFMARLTASGLIRRAAADILTDPATTAGVTPGKLPAGVSRAPRIRVRCNLGLASCRRWLALERRKLRRRATRVSKR
jgi:hypothetical protein